MKRRTRRNLTLAGVAVAIGAIGWYAWGPHTRSPHLHSGYVEGEPLYLSAAVPGTVSDVSVERGQRVEPGQPLFAIDAGPLVAQRQQAAGALAAAQAQAADARKGASHLAADARKTTNKKRHKADKVVRRAVEQATGA